jgi:hypothetical protein
VHEKAVAHWRAVAPKTKNKRNKHTAKNFSDYLKKYSIPLKKSENFKIAIIEMYPRIP